MHSPGLGAGEKPAVLSRTWGPPGSRPRACAFASSMACFRFSTSLSRCVRSTCQTKTVYSEPDAPSQTDVYIT